MRIATLALPGLLATAVPAEIPGNRVTNGCPLVQ